MESLLNIDERLFYLINQGWSSGILDAILIPWRNSITWAPLYVFIISFFFFNYGKKGYWLFMFCLLTVGSSDIVSSRIVKPTVERARPCHDNSGVEPTVRVRCGSGYSFTSSHATNHFAIAGFLIFTFGFLFRWIKYPLLAWASVICLAQVYVGVHYPFDVLCGAVLGLAIGWIWSAIFKRYYHGYVFNSISQDQNLLQA